MRDYQDRLPADKFKLEMINQDFIELLQKHNILVGSLVLIMNSTDKKTSFAGGIDGADPCVPKKDLEDFSENCGKQFQDIVNDWYTKKLAESKPTGEA